MEISKCMMESLDCCICQYEGVGGLDENAFCGVLKIKPQQIRHKKECKMRKCSLSVQTILMRHLLYRNADRFQSQMGMWAQPFCLMQEKLQCAFILVEVNAEETEHDYRGKVLEKASGDGFQQKGGSWNTRHSSAITKGKANLIDTYRLVDLMGRSERKFIFGY